MYSQLKHQGIIWKLLDRHLVGAPSGSHQAVISSRSTVDSFLNPGVFVVIAKLR
jgi:hypothetical protein